MNRSPDGDDDEGPASPIAKIIMAVLVVIGIALACYISIDQIDKSTFIKTSIAPLFAVTIATLLAIFPLVIGFVQATSRKRQIKRLENLASWPVAETICYKAALSSVKSLRPASVTSEDYRWPMINFCTTVVIATLAVFVSLNLVDIFKYKSFILVGVLADTDFSAYQIGTFTMIAYAFVGSYVCIIAQLLSRVNNNDISPISFHFYTAWIITAGLAAAVVRHVLYLLLNNKAPELLILIGFAVGCTPNLFIGAILRRAFGYLQIIGDKADPDRTLLPTNMNLLMIDGITMDQIARLGELGITNAQVLAAQNPFLLWPRLPYELWLLVDWIAQAQLYVRVRDQKFSALRGTTITNIFHLHTYLSAPADPAAVAKLLDIPETVMPSFLASLEDDASFVRLKAVKDAMKQSDLLKLSVACCAGCTI